MSGLEVAGVVLGTIPLVVSGLDKYRRALSALKLENGGRTARDLERAELELKFQEAILRNTLNHLFSKASIPLLSETPFGPNEWKEINGKLLDFLGQSDFDLFVSSLRQIQDSSAQLAAALDAVKGRFTESQSRNIDALLARRLRWSLRDKAQTDQLLSQVQLGNSDLKYFLDNVLISRERIANVTNYTQAFAEAVVSDATDDADSLKTVPLSVDFPTPKCYAQCLTCYRMKKNKSLHICALDCQAIPAPRQRHRPRDTHA